MIVQKELHILVLVAVSLVRIHGLATTRVCYWDSKTTADFPVNPPLIFDDKLNLVLPELINKKPIIRVDAGSELIISCSREEIDNDQPFPGPYFVNYPGAIYHKEAVCVGGLQIRVDGVTTTMKEMGCVGPVTESMFNYGSLGHDIQCGDLNDDMELKNGKQHFIGFHINPNKNYHQITACFDSDTEKTLTTEHILYGANIEARIANPSSNFRTGVAAKLFTVPMNTIYDPSTQIELFQDTLSETIAAEVFDKVNGQYFQKGHMAKNGDFVTSAEQRASFLYLNAFPQWGIINSNGDGKNGNWKKLEDDIHVLAKTKKRDFRIITGGESILELEGEKLEDGSINYVKIFLAKIKYKKELVPAPELTWKIVYDESFKKAVVLITDNNHLQVAPDDEIGITMLCEQDICDKITWLKQLNALDPDSDEPNRKNYAHGYTYCCSYIDFEKGTATTKAANVPYLDVLNGLLNN